MNHTETLKLCRYIQALCPAQKIDQYTPDAWNDILNNITYDEAKTAIHTIATTDDKRQLIIDPRMIYNQVKKQRQHRIETTTPNPDNRPPTNPTEYCKWLKQQNHQQAQLEKQQWANNHTIKY